MSANPSLRRELQINKQTPLRGKDMNRFTAPFAGSMLAICCAMGSAYAQTTTTAPAPAPMTNNMTPATTSSDRPMYKDEKDQIKASYKSAMSQCDSLTDNAKDVCKAQAKGDRKKAEAKLDNEEHPTPRSAEKMALANADADYDVAKTKCDAQTGNDKDVCKANAKEAYKSAKADAKANKKVAEARSADHDAKGDAAYDDARAKCDAMPSGAGKDQCFANAKSTYNK
jgi:hypothetical protein